MASTAAPGRIRNSPSASRVFARWMVSFAGFPLGGLAAMTLVGPVDSFGSAMAGGFVTGLVLGAAQAWALRFGGRSGVLWALATAVGLAVGLTAGASVVGLGTGTDDLAVQGAVSGAAVGSAQTVVLLTVGAVRPRIKGPGSGRTRIALAWPVYLAAVWSVGWTVTTSIGVRVDEQFTVFGSAGAVTAAALTSILPLVLVKNPILDRPLNRERNL